MQPFAAKLWIGVRSAERVGIGETVVVLSIDAGEVALIRDSGLVESWSMEEIVLDAKAVTVLPSAMSVLPRQ